MRAICSTSFFYLQVEALRPILTFNIISFYLIYMIFIVIGSIKLLFKLVP